MLSLLKKHAYIGIVINFAGGCSSNGVAGELGFLFIGGLVVVATLVFIIEKAKSKGRITPESDSRLNNERGKHLNNYLEQTKNAFTLFEKQMEKSVSGFKNQDSNDDSDSRNKK